MQENPMFKVLLSHEANPDIPNGYWNGTRTEGAAERVVPSLADASQVCIAYIRNNDLGAGNFSGGQVLRQEGGAWVPHAQVSYNGRVWALDGAEIPTA